MMIRTIIFDFFDVIRTDGFNRWLRVHGYKKEGAFRSASEQLNKGEINTTQFFQLLGNASGEPADQIQKAMDSGNELNVEVVALIAELHSKYQTVLLSNSSSAYLRAELAKYDLEKHFDGIFISGETGFIKPRRDAFEHTLRSLGVKPEEAVFIDDNPEYVRVAEAMGIHGIVYAGVTALRTDLNKLLSV